MAVFCLPYDCRQYYSFTTNIITNIVPGITIVTVVVVAAAISTLIVLSVVTTVISLSLASPRPGGR